MQIPFPINYSHPNDIQSTFSCEWYPISCPPTNPSSLFCKLGLMNVARENMLKERQEMRRSNFLYYTKITSRGTTDLNCPLSHLTPQHAFPQENGPWLLRKVIALASLHWKGAERGARAARHSPRATGKVSHTWVPGTHTGDLHQVSRLWLQSKSVLSLLQAQKISVHLSFKQIVIFKNLKRFSLKKKACNTI